MPGSGGSGSWAGGGGVLGDTYHRGGGGSNTEHGTICIYIYISNKKQRLRVVPSTLILVQTGVPTLRKLIVVRCVRPDRVLPAVQVFVVPQITWGQPWFERQTSKGNQPFWGPFFFVLRQTHVVFWGGQGSIIALAA